MSVWQGTPSASALCGSEGELVAVSIFVDPRALEPLLDALAHLHFPLNPQIYHADAQAREPRTRVEFPAYAGRVPEVRQAAETVRGAEVRVTSMLDEIHALLKPR
jgi:hypothetical protein